MFTKKPPNQLQTVINKLLADMEVETNPDDYDKMVTQLIKLYKLKEQDAPRRISPDTMVIVAGNIVGIAMILSHERLNVITSKAVGFVLRSK